MASLYRCRARVAYRPARSNNLFVFEEKQIQELIVKLKWQPNLAFSAADASTSASIATTALSQSSCSVTISDPYLTGLAWPALYDASSLYNVSNIAASNNINLPACTENQDPKVDKCYRYTEFIPEPGDNPGGWAFLIISLWYDIGGGSFGSDYYFRVQSLAISHGTKYPSVTIRGAEARSVLFNQSLVNLGFEENLPVNEALKRITKSLGYEAEFCINPNSSPDPELDAEKKLPRAFRFKGVTHAEAMSRLINTTGGNMLSLPTKEYAKKISICARADINQGCSVFYLGKGLYEGYEITGTLENGLLVSNLETPGINANNADPYISNIPKANLYTIQDILPTQRAEALKNVKKLAFPSLFLDCKPKCTTKEFDGVIWKSPGKVVKGEGTTVISEVVKGLNLRGIAPNGPVAISFLSGEVEEGTSADGGRVTIKTDFYFKVKIPDKNNKEQAFNSRIFQESTNLTSIKVKARDRVTISQEIGSSTTEKPEFVRFFIKGNDGEFITVAPELVWQYALSSITIPPAPPAVSSGSVTTPGQAVPSAPKASLKDWNATTTQKPNKILITPGHGDITSGETGAPGEKALVYEVAKWMQRNATRYGIQDYVEFSIPSPTTNIPNANDERALWTQGERIVNSGGKAIDLHMDTSTGKSGVIPPCGRSRSKIGVLDDELAKIYGAFSANWGNCLGGPARGVTILELGRMDAATKAAANSTDPAIRERLYAQLADPLMRSIAAEKARSGAPTTPATTSTVAPASAPRICFKMGNSGRSSGPHLHAEWGDGRGGGSRPITAEQVRKYLDVPGTITSTYRSSSRPDHNGVDIAAPLGTPMCLKEGVSVKEIGETKCPDNGNGCGAGKYGNAVVIQTPEGPMLLAHLALGGIPPEAIPGAISGGSGIANGGNTQLGAAAAPGINGLNVETVFKGVPRALRIIPGRTILSFISDYDAWVENGRAVEGSDPGVWIAARYKNWMINQCDFKWRDGDLKVNIEGVSAWGNQVFKVPTFDKFMEGLRADRGKYATSSQFSNTYYDYIRSPGSLSWVMENGKDSTEVLCDEAQTLSNILFSSGDNVSGAPTSTPAPAAVNNTFPAAKCQYIGSKYPRDRVNGIINAARIGGITSKAAYAGILGNAIVESRQNGELNPGAINFKGCVGIFQWCDRRKNLQRFAQSKGRSEFDFATQMEFFVAEITQGSGYTDTTSFREGDFIAIMNRQTDPNRAAFEFNRLFERAVKPGGLQGDAERRAIAKEIFDNLSCQ